MIPDGLEVVAGSGLPLELLPHGLSLLAYLLLHSEFLVGSFDSGTRCFESELLGCFLRAQKVVWGGDLRGLRI